MSQQNSQMCPDADLSDVTQCEQLHQAHPSCVLTPTDLVSTTGNVLQHNLHGASHHLTHADTMSTIC